MNKDFEKIVSLNRVIQRKINDVDLDEGQQKVAKSFDKDIQIGRLSEQKLIEFCSILANHYLRSEAAKFLETALELIPGSNLILAGYVKTLLELKKEAQAETVLKKRLQIQKNDWPATRLLGRLYFSQGKSQDYLNLIDEYLDSNTDHIEALLEKADLKIKYNYQDVLSAIEAVLSVDPIEINGLSKKLHLYCQTGELDKAQDVLDMMWEHHPDKALTPYSEGLLYDALRDYEKALKAYNRAIEIDNSFLNAYGKSGQVMLRLGLDLEEAWYRLESRFPNLQERPDGPMWRGQDLKYKRLFIWAEQGIGDQIDFSSMLRDLPNNLHSVNIECDGKLVELFQRSYPQFTFHPRNSKRDFLYDFNIPIGALARYLRTTYDSFTTSPIHYLKPDPVYVEKWTKWLDGLGEGKKIGLTWKSGTSSTCQTRAYLAPGRGVR